MLMMDPALILYKEFALFRIAHISDHVDDEDSFNNKGVSLTKIHKFDEAQYNYDQALLINPNNFTYLINKGNHFIFIVAACLNNLIRDREALEYANKAIEINQSSWSSLAPLYLYGAYQKNLNVMHTLLYRSFTASIQQFQLMHNCNALGELERYDEAIDCFDEAIQIEPNVSVYYYDKGNALGELERYEEAIDCFDEAIQIEPNVSVYYYDKGNALYALKRYDEAIECFDKAIQIQPNDSDYYYNKGIILDDLKRYDEAIKCYEKAIQFQTNDSTYYCNKGITLGQLKRYDEAIQCFDQAIQIQPNDSDYYYNKGTALFKLKMYDQAIECCDKAIKIKPSPELYSFQAYVLEAMGQKQAAYKKYKQALALDHQFQNAIAAINRLKQLNK